MKEYKSMFSYDYDYLPKYTFNMQLLFEIFELSPSYYQELNTFDNKIINSSPPTFFKIFKWN